MLRIASATGVSLPDWQLASCESPPPPCYPVRKKISGPVGRIANPSHETPAGYEIVRAEAITPEENGVIWAVDDPAKRDFQTNPDGLQEADSSQLSLLVSCSKISRLFARLLFSHPARGNIEFLRASVYIRGVCHRCLRWSEAMISTVHAIYENGVFRPVDRVDLPDNTPVEFEPRVLTETSQTPMSEGLAKIYEILGRRYSSGYKDTAARHNEHQP